MTDILLTFLFQVQSGYTGTNRAVNLGCTDESRRYKAVQKGVKAGSAALKTVRVRGHEIVYPVLRGKLLSKCRPFEPFS